MEIPMIIIKITAASWIIFPLALFGLFKYAQNQNQTMMQL